VLSDNAMRTTSRTESLRTRDAVNARICINLRCTKPLPQRCATTHCARARNRRCYRARMIDPARMSAQPRRWHRNNHGATITPRNQATIE
jgi:hypothetical protein